MSENKKLTIEEFAEIKYPLEVGYGVFDRNCEIENLREAFVEGYKLAQDKKLYSEEEQLHLLNEYNEYLFSFIDKDEVGIGVEKEDVVKWFEQFKKK
jgi:hypothetical protein